LVGNPKGNRQLERPWSRWEDNIKTDLGGIGLKVMDWIHMALDGDP
jgi:hypothetical protein